ncbi:MAG TPA: hypothetical protein PLU75_06715 [Oscillospiraceae bacterium]|nr:hypothetical protein [Oscillospiraceae bacterium]HQQ88678.1 hypothetical protein [Oscillospiraceae bacterium]HRW57763.1 hypothetical protein [Oscillospiraceae bacterium]
MEALKKILNKLGLSGAKSSAAGGRIILILGFAGIALIFLSEFVSCGGSAKTTETGEIPSYLPELETKLENRVRLLVEGIDGAGKAEVLITFSGGYEYEYLSDTEMKEEENAESVLKSETQTYIIVDGSAGDSALVRKILVPEINGAAVICEGGGNPQVAEKVIRAVSTALGISSSKVFVAKKA